MSTAGNLTIGGTGGFRPIIDKATGRQRKDAHGRLGWEWRFTYKGEDGRSHQARGKAYGTKRQAEDERERQRREIEAKLNRGRVSGANPTVGEVLDAWEARRTSIVREDDRGLSKETVERERPILKRLGAELGEVRLSDLTTEHVERAYVSIAERDGLSQDGVFKMHAKLKQVMERCVDAGLVGRNPCRGIDRNLVRQPARIERQPLTKEQVSMLVRELWEEKQDGRRIAVWLALATGMRRGELLGLTWGDVDLEGRSIVVSRQYSRQHVNKPAKGRRSRRFPIDAITTAYLSRWRDEQTRRFGTTGEATPVCTNTKGGRLDATAFTHWRQEYFVRLGLGRWTYGEEYETSNGKVKRRRSYSGAVLHGLRHTQISLLVAGNQDLAAIRDRVGHRDLEVTTIYTHVMPQGELAAAEYIGRIFEDALGEEGR